MIEIVGFLSVDPALSYHWNGNSHDENEINPDSEVLTHNPPPSLVPRIHAIHIERMKHYNPLVKQECSTGLNNFKNIKITLIFKLRLTFIFFLLQK